MNTVLEVKDEPISPAKAFLIEEIKEADEYMKLVEKGERKTQSLKDLLKS